MVAVSGTAATGNESQKGEVDESENEPNTAMNHEREWRDGARAKARADKTGE